MACIAAMRAQKLSPYGRAPVGAVLIGPNSTRPCLCAPVVFPSSSASMLITMPQTSCSACAAAQLVSDPRAEFVVLFQRSGPSGTPWVKLQQTARGRHLPIEIGATRCPLGCRLKIRTGLLESPPTGACMCMYSHVHVHVHVHAHVRFATRQASRGPRKAGTSSSPTHRAFNASHALAGHIVTPSPLKDIHDLHVDSAGYKRGSQRL
eukprot:scaffold130493_cov57-Phaeocystis_antarctica.AAC.1